MAREREVKVTILGEDKGASKALNQVDNAAAKLGPSGKIAQSAMDGVNSKLSELGPVGAKVSGALDKVGVGATSTGALLAGALAGGAVVAGVALAKFAFDGMNALVDLAAEVRTFQRASGLGAEDASRMVAVLDDMGISSDAGASAMFKLAKNVSDGGEKLAQYGVHVGRTKDGNVDLVSTLASVADAYVATEDPAKRAELVMAAFGKAGRDLIPVLEQGAAGFTAMFDAVKRGEILSQKQIDDARRFELALDDVQDSWRSLQMRAGAVVLPFATMFAEAGTAALDLADRMGGKGGFSLSSVVDRLPASMGPLRLALLTLGVANAGVGEEAAGAAAKFDLQVSSLEALGVEVSDAEKATGKFTEQTKAAAAEAEKQKQKIEVMAAAVGSAYVAMGAETAELTEKQRSLAQGFDTAKNAADLLKGGLDILVGVKINATRAAIDWEAQIVKTSATLGENKATLDITTEAGRENTTAIFDMIKAGNSHVEAMQREGASSAEVTAAYSDHVEALRRVMTQAGYSEQQINTLLEQYNLLAAAPDINKNVNTYHNQYHTDYYNTVRGQDPWVGSMHSGGIVEGHGEVLKLLEGGEGVFTPEQMAAIGRGLSRSGAGTGDRTSAQDLAQALAAALAPALARQSGMTVHMTEKVDPMHLAREIAWAMS